MRSRDSLHAALLAIAEKAAAVGAHGTSAQRRDCLTSIESYARSATRPATDHEEWCDLFMTECSCDRPAPVPGGRFEILGGKTVRERVAQIRAEQTCEEVTATKIAEHNFRNGEVFGLKLAVAHLRGAWDGAADIVERIIAQKEAP